MTGESAFSARAVYAVVSAVEMFRQQECCRRVGMVGSSSSGVCPVFDGRASNREGTGNFGATVGWTQAE